MADAHRSTLDAVALTRLMAIELGRSEIIVALVDGPVDLSHPALSSARIRSIGPDAAHACELGPACRHGTFVAGILSATRSSEALGICPGCTLLVRPIFSERWDSEVPRTTSSELARAIVESLDAGANVINISAALSPTVGRDPALEAALYCTARRGAIVVAAAGNEGTVASSPLTRHPAVIPVGACDVAGRLAPTANLARSLGTRGVAAPGTVTSLSPAGAPMTLSGTSFAAAVVSAACALLWSSFPAAASHDVAHAVTHRKRRRSVAPPRLDTWAAYQQLLHLEAVA